MTAVNSDQSRELAARQGIEAKDASVGRSSAVSAIGTLLSRLTGLVRTTLLLEFSLTAFTDAYNIGNTVPNMIYELLIGGVLSATIVPIFGQLRRKDTRRAREGVDAIVSLIMVLTTVAALVLALGARWIAGIQIDGNAKPGTLDLASKLIPLFALRVIAYGFVTLATAQLNVRRRFFAAMAAPVLNNLVVIVVLLVVRQQLRDYDETEYLGRVLAHGPTRLLLGLGTTAGVVAMALAMAVSLRRAGVRTRWRWEPDHPAIREIVRISAWTFGYVACNIGALQLVQRMITKLNDGDATAYSQAYSTFFQLPHGLIAVSITTALQPRLADAFLERKRGRFRATLRDGLSNQLTLMVPAAVGYLVLARPIIAIFRSDANDVERIAGVLRSFSIGLPAFSAFLLLMNACRAMRNTKLAFWLNAFETVCNLVLAYTFWKLELGVKGLALAFALAYCIGVVVAFLAVAKRTRGLDARVIWDNLGRVLLASFVMAVATEVVRRYVHSFTGATGALTLRGRLRAIVEVGISTAVGVTVYVTAGHLFGVRGLTTLVDKFTRRLRLPRGH